MSTGSKDTRPKDTADYQWKLPNTQWRWCTFLSESFPIDLLAIHCKKRLVVVLRSKKRYSECKNSLSKVRRCQSCYTAFCSLTGVVEHVDQNIFTLFVFQRNKMELHLLCFRPSVCTPALTKVIWICVRVCVPALMCLCIISPMHLPSREITAWAPWFIRWSPSDTDTEVVSNTRSAAGSTFQQENESRQLLLWKS